MNDALRQMLARYRCVSTQDYKNALKELMQEIALLGLWRGKFFEHAAFYGGTALRILYQLDRFSEDLDFSLLKPDPNFSWQRYRTCIESELQAYGLRSTFSGKQKTADSAIHSAFVKSGTLELLLEIGLPTPLIKGVGQLEAIKIKVEVDTQPPSHFETETRFLLQPIPFSIRSFAAPDLFAGKMHALLCRGWKKRVKGRDWYDFIWFVARQIPLHLLHLEKRMQQSGHLAGDQSLNRELLSRLLSERIEKLELEQAKADIAPFLKDPSAIEIWSKPFFKAVAEQMVTC